jgi:hypothetical protein
LTVLTHPTRGGEAAATCRWGTWPCGQQLEVALQHRQLLLLVMQVRDNRSLSRSDGVYCARANGEIVSRPASTSSERVGPHLLALRRRTGGRVGRNILAAALLIGAATGLGLVRSAPARAAAAPSCPSSLADGTLQSSVPNLDETKLDGLRELTCHYSGGQIYDVTFTVLWEVVGDRLVGGCLGAPATTSDSVTTYYESKTHRAEVTFDATQEASKGPSQVLAQRLLADVEPLALPCGGPPPVAPADLTCPPAIGGLPLTSSVRILSDADQAKNPKYQRDDRTLDCFYKFHDSIQLAVNWYVDPSPVVLGCGDKSFSVGTNNHTYVRNSGTRRAWYVYIVNTRWDPSVAPLIRPLAEKWLAKVEPLASACHGGSGGIALSGGGTSGVPFLPLIGGGAIVVMAAATALFVRSKGGLGQRSAAAPTLAASGSDVIYSGPDAIRILQSEGWIHQVGSALDGRPLYRPVGDLAQFDNLPQGQPQLQHQPSTPGANQPTTLGGIAYQPVDASGAFTEMTIVVHEVAVPAAAIPPAPTPPPAPPPAAPPAAAPAAAPAPQLPGVNPQIQRLQSLLSSSLDPGPTTIRAPDLLDLAHGMAPSAIGPDGTISSGNYAGFKITNPTISGGHITMTINPPDFPMGMDVSGSVSVDSQGMLQLKVTKIPSIPGFGIPNAAQATKLIRPAVDGYNQALHAHGLRVTSVSADNGQLVIDKLPISSH